MVTIVTHVPLKDGTEGEWDARIAERMAAAKKQPGWVGGQLLRSPNGRVIVGTWETRDAWAEWHKTSAFTRARRELDDMADGPTEPGWHEVVLEVRKSKASPSKRAVKAH